MVTGHKDSAKATGHHGRSPQPADPSEPLPGCLSGRGANAIGRITLSLHAPTPVIPHITHPNGCVGRRGGNLPARAATPPLPSGTSGTPGQWLSADVHGALTPTRALMSARARAVNQVIALLSLRAFPHSRGPVTFSTDDSSSFWSDHEH